MKTEGYKIAIYIDGLKVAENYGCRLSYSVAKDRLYTIAEDWMYRFKEQGKELLQRVTFGGISRHSDPIPELYRQDYPDAVLLHVQKIRMTKRKVSRVCYEVIPC